MSTIAIDMTPEGIAAEKARRRYLRDPVGWITDRCGEFAWSKQAEIAESVRDNRRTAVQSAHDIGKSWLAARIAVWWLQTHPIGEAFVVTSAPTGDQVKAILWREIGRAHAKAGAHGLLNQTEWWSEPINRGKEEIIAFGRKPAEFNPSAFQGIHARFVLVIFDEAAGIPKPLWEAASGLITNDESRFLAIGNPTDPISHFATVCKPGSGWHVIRVSAFDTPMFTGEAVPPEVLPLLIGRTWVEEARLDWAPMWEWSEDGRRVLPPAGVSDVDESAAPMWFAKVLGQFPRHASDALIPMQWIQAAIDRDLPPGQPNELGVDVGGGNDRSIIAHRRGPVIRIIKRTNTPDTMETAGHVIQALRETGATIARVDFIGIGRGVVDNCRQQQKPVIGVNVAEMPRDKERFVNKRAELYWAFRMRAQAGDLDLDANDRALVGQLGALKFKTNARGQIQIESKDDMRRRGLPSPDDADAAVLSTAGGDHAAGNLIATGAKPSIAKSM